MGNITNWLTGIIISAQVIKLFLNWSVHNILNPQHRVETRINHPGVLFEKNGIKKASETDLMFMYCAFTFFWVKIPKQKSGKIMAWSVLGLTIIQIISIIITVNINE